MEKWFYGRGFVAARDARRCSGCARTATAGSAIAARLAAWKLDASNVALPTGATNGVWRAGSIIATGNGRTGNVTRRLA
jgi:D-arabinose 5-phosphate isomerase GutQ